MCNWNKRRKNKEIPEIKIAKLYCVLCEIHYRIRTFDLQKQVQLLSHQISVSKPCPILRLSFLDVKVYHRFAVMISNIKSFISQATIVTASIPIQKYAGNQTPFYIEIMTNSTCKNCFLVIDIKNQQKFNKR